MRSDGFVAKSLRPESQVIRDITNTIGNKTIYRDLFLGYSIFWSPYTESSTHPACHTGSLTGQKVSFGTPAPGVLSLVVPVVRMTTLLPYVPIHIASRSEERRVGKEC